ncbi:hypothetical protein EVAR_70965_1 [Eumeta japonica]|uniref:Uncharacterized protein n=1 Tax=Eumeta variegata TaxID=151549 RepID=A0A4C1SNF3_EUMVA|nr:hypothetical protein EVAR_70965_1 [Eumeta japonica]
MYKHNLVSFQIIIRNEKLMSPQSRLTSFTHTKFTAMNAAARPSKTSALKAKNFARIRVQHLIGVLQTARHSKSPPSLADLVGRACPKSGERSRQCLLRPHRAAKTRTGSD